MVAARNSSTIGSSQARQNLPPVMLSRTSTIYRNQRSLLKEKQELRKYKHMETQ